jgi:hypothetical protein
LTRWPGLEQAGDGAEEGGLAAAGRAEEDGPGSVEIERGLEVECADGGIDGEMVVGRGEVGEVGC